jgi:flagellar basal-body rod modification protein FlgD
MEISSIKNNYIKQDKSVNIKEYLKQKEFIEQNNLQNVEIVDKVKTLGKDDFLKLLITQLSHQDPTQPMTDQQFIAQMAQFSSLEQMQNIAKSIEVMNQSQNFYYLGKYVIGKDSISGEEVQGLVEAIFKDESGEVYLKVKESAINKNNILVVGLPERFIKNQTYQNSSNGELSNNHNSERNLERSVPKTEIPKKNLEKEMQLKEYNQNTLIQ